MRNLLVCAVALALVTSASAATFTATIDLPNGNQAVRGTPLAIRVLGSLDTDLDNDGLVFVSVDITAAGPADLDTGSAVNWGPPSDGSMDNFVQPAGYDANYGGTPVGLSLLQSGGAQNTIGNDPNAPPNLPFPSAEFIDFGVANNGTQVIFDGTITVPSDQALGTYTLTLENVLANVLADGQTPVSFGVYAVEAADGVGSSVDIDVVEGCAAPDFIAGAAGVSAMTRIYDGFIDPLRESANGVDIIGLDSFTFQFTTALQNNDGSPLSAAAFSIADTAGTPPAITGITTADGQIVTVNLSDHITLQAWTTFTVSAQSVCAQIAFDGSIDVGFLPADVNQDGFVNPLDLLRFKQYVNNVTSPPLGVIEDFIDTNRSGGINPLDLLSFKQLINGVSPPSTQTWAGQSLPTQP